MQAAVAWGQEGGGGREGEVVSTAAGDDVALS